MTLTSDTPKSSSSTCAHEAINNCASFACSVTRSTTNGVSTQRHDDEVICAKNDLRLEMAHLRQCGMSVFMKVKLRTTENKRACAMNCALTSTSVSLHKSGLKGLFRTSSSRFTQKRNRSTSATSSINDLLQSFRFPGTYCVYQIQQLKHRLCVLLNHAVTAMDSLHGFVSQLSSHPFLFVSSAPSAFPSSFPRNRQILSTSASRCLRSNSPLACSHLL